MFRVARFSLPLVSLVSVLVPCLCFAQSPNPPAPQEAARQAADQQLASPTKLEGSASSPPGPSAPTTVLANPLGEAKILYRKGDFTGAISRYQQVLQQNPLSPDAYAGLIRVYLKQKNVDQAIQTAEKGLSQSNAPRIRVARAEIWFRQGKIHEAEHEWVDVINSGYPEARAYLGLARVRDALAMYKSAKTMTDKAYELDPSDPDIQKKWVGTLSRAERIKYLQESLAGENNGSSEERESSASYLEYLKERAKDKKNACRLVSKIAATETPLVRLLIDPEHLRGYGLAVDINGHRNSLMLDTGAGGIVIKRGIAERAGISKITASKVGGVGSKGLRDAYVGIADSIKIGDLEFQNCPVEVMESRTVVGEDGLIGADVFEDFLIEIDFPHEKLKLGQLPRRPGEAEQQPALKNEDDDASETAASETAQSPSNSQNTTDKKDASTSTAHATTPGPQDRYIAPEMRSYSQVFRFGHHLLIPTSIGKVPPKLFLIDTGALTNTISPAAAREVTKVSSDDTIVKGVSGSVNKVYTANKAVLQFGHIRQENQDMTAFDNTWISDAAGTEISGFLGFTTLRMLDIKIDYRDALVDFNYDPRAWTH